MSRLQYLLTIVILIESLWCGWQLHTHWNRPSPPIPNLAGYNAYTSRRLLDTIAQHDANIADSWANLADAYLATGFFPEAEASLRRAVQLAPDDANLRYRWSFCLTSLGEFGQAKRQLQEAIAAGHDRPTECWYLIGRVLLCEEQPTEAQAAFIRANELPAARYELAKLNLRAGRLEEAVSEVAQVEQRLPQVRVAHWLRGHAEFLLGHSALAENYFDLSELFSEQLPTPTHDFRRRMQGILDIYSSKRVVDQALELRAHHRQQQVDSLLKDTFGTQWDAEVADLRATMALDRGDVAAYRREVESIIARDGADSYRLLRLGIAYSSNNDSAAATAAYLGAVTLNNDVRGIESWRHLAKLADEIGDAPRARKYQAQHRLATALVFLGELRFPEARIALRESLEFDPGEPRTWFYLGEVERHSGDRAAAVVAYERCLQLNPHHGRALAAQSRLDRPAPPAQG